MLSLDIQYYENLFYIMQFNAVGLQQILLFLSLYNIQF